MSDASLLSTPRALKEPVRWNSSAFRWILGDRLDAVNIGVRCRTPAITPAARRTSSTPVTVTVCVTWSIVPPQATGIMRPAVEPTRPPAVRLVVTDDLKRYRLIVFLRLIVMIPHFIWIVLWSIAVAFAAVAGWFMVVITGRLPAGLHGFSAAFVRYSTHFLAFLYLAADQYPGFKGRPGYPVDVEIDDPVRQSRLGAFFRLVLAIPAS